MGIGNGVLVVLSDGLVEVVVLFVSDFRLVSEPDGLDLVNGLPFPDLLSHSLGFLFTRFFFDLTLVLDLIISLGWLFFLFLDLLADFLRDE